MKDNLKDYILDHRDEFDDKIPDGNIWAALEDRLNQDRRVPGSHRLVIRYFSGPGKRWISAAAVLLLCISLAAFIRTYQVKTQGMNKFIPEDLTEAGAFYEHQITLKIERIKSMENKYNSMDTSLWQLFGQHDEEYNRLQKAIRENPGDPHVHAAFVEYYRSRLAVLSRIERKMEQDSVTTK